MGKGKKAKASKQKKDGDTPKEEEEVASAIAAISVSADQASEATNQPSPSTSREASVPSETAPPAEEEEGGLDLGPRKIRKKRPPKKKPVETEKQASDKAGGDSSATGATQVTGPPPATAAVPAPAWAAKQQPIPSGIAGTQHAQPPGFQYAPPGFIDPSQGVPPGAQHPGIQYPGYQQPAFPHPGMPGPQPFAAQACPQTAPHIQTQTFPQQRDFQPQQIDPLLQQRSLPPQQAAFVPEQRGPLPQHAAYGPQQRGPPPQHAASVPQQRGPQPQHAASVQQQRPPQPQYAPSAPQQRGPPPQHAASALQQRGPPPQHAASAPQQKGPPPQHAASAPQQRGPLLQQAASADPARQSTAVAPFDRFRIPDKVIGTRVPSRKLRLLTNYLPMTIKPLKIHRYDVSFKPDKPKKMIPKAFLMAKKKLFPKHIIAFDQTKNCYSLEPFPNVTTIERQSTVVEIIDNNGRSLSFEVTFKGTGIVDLGTIEAYMKNRGSSLNPPTEAIQCVDVILRQGTLENYIKAGRQFFKRPANPIPLGDGLEMWTGLFQSAIFTSRPFVNIDVAHKGFPKQQPLIDALSKDFRLDPNQRIDRNWAAEAFNQFVKGLRVVALIGGDCSSSGKKREFICNEVVDPPGDIFFLMKEENGKERSMSVLDYFVKVKGIRLRYPKLNCMWVGPRDKKIYYPMELLEISYGQALNRQLNERQLSTMVKEAATPPDQRKAKIEEVIRDMNYSANANFKKFGLEIENQFFEVNAKVLAPPKLDVGGRSMIQPAKGSWQANSLLLPKALDAWAIVGLELDVRQSNGENIISLIKSVGGQMGMTVKDPIDRFYNTAMNNLKRVLDRAVDIGVKFLIIIVPTRGRDYYHKVKQLAERNVGILTQCIKENTAARRMNPQTAKNILLKMNSKMMGINQALDKSCMPACLASGGVMVVGADVTHPSPDQSSVPSIAAVTASIDPKCFLYNIQLSVQTPKKEMIVEFEDMMYEHLKVYAKTHNGLPRKIFVFRDGVSEGQFAQVMHSELQAVHRAYQRLAGPQKRPEVLFLLVQKRHHTRFFNKDPRGASYNVEPGTVVDEDIVHARELDFYMVSHQAIKGTARPTRYHAVCNDGKIPHDEVEQLTYYLCHLYSRCMRAVSYPTPTYYAHLACLRARSLTHGERFDNLDLEQHPQRLKVLDKMLAFSRMFFV